jgi:hypothetical protein
MSNLSTRLLDYRDIESFPGYRIGSDGSVLSSRGCKDWRPLRTYVGTHGYFAVGLRKDRKHYVKTCHTLVAITFLGPRPKGQEVRHIDGDRLNCRLENLCWGTHSENSLDRRRHGSDQRGEGGSAAKLTDQDVLSIRSQHQAGRTQTSLAEQFGVSRGNIYQILKREIWPHI